MTPDELLRFAFSQGSNQTVVIAGETGPGGPAACTTTAGQVPGHADTRSLTALPAGTAGLLEAVPYRGHAADGADDPLGHALSMAFGLQRRETANCYNDHRGYPSVRSKFPVHAFVIRDGRQSWLDVYRHALADMGAAVAGREPGEITLAGRYPHLPSGYGRIRGTLIDIELGIGLRSLAVALGVFGVPYQVELPGAMAEERLAELGLAPASEWSLPVSVLSGPRTPAGRRARPGPAAAVVPGDPVLQEVIAANRAGASRPADPAVPAESAVPPGGDVWGRGVSWADVLWARGAGSMPRGLMGMSARRGTQPGAVIEDMADWAAVRPPSGLLRQAWNLLTVTVCLQGVEGYADGVYRLADGRLSLAAAGNIGAALEAGYSHRQTRDAGCGVRAASAVWFVSARPRDLAALGTWSWPLAWLVGGWVIQGVSLAAAASGLACRPARAFQETDVAPLLRLPPDEMILIAGTCAAPRFRESPLDLRL
jgi:hypothetical protein